MTNNLAPPPPQPPPIDFDTLTWRCHCCGQERKDRYIKVAKHDISHTMDQPAGSAYFNCRYCLDMPLCIQRAHDQEWILKKFGLKKDAK